MQVEKPQMYVISNEWNLHNANSIAYPSNSHGYQAYSWQDWILLHCISINVQLSIARLTPSTGVTVMGLTVPANDPNLLNGTGVSLTPS